MRFLVVALTVALAMPASSLVAAGAAQTEAASVAGIAASSTGATLANTTVQLRDLDTGKVVDTTTSSSTGSFSFAAVRSGNYAVEILNAAGQVVGTSASIPVAAGGAVTGVSVMAGGIAAATGGIGLSTIMAVTSAAAAAGVIGVVRRGNGDASPSR